MRFCAASLVLAACVGSPIVDLGDESSSSGQEHATTGASASSAVSTDASASTTAATTTSTTSTTGADTGTTTASTTGGGECPPFPSIATCTDDEDCAVEGDCCECYVFNHHIESPQNCGGACDQDMCTQLAVSKAICNQGFCEGVGLSCDANDVVCNAVPPACQPGFLPRIIAGCYAGDCIPVEHCDGVTSCSDCPAGWTCGTLIATGCERHDCGGPPDPECDGLGLCDCYGPCDPPYDTCTDVPGGYTCS
jgi:hypothetical protein